MGAMGEKLVPTGRNNEAISRKESTYQARPFAVGS